MFHPSLLAQTFTAQVVRSQLRWELLQVAVAIVLLVAGVSAIALFSLRRKTRDLTLVYFGLISILYGIRLLAKQGVIQALFAITPSTWALLIWFIPCTINVPVGLFIYQFASDAFRRLGNDFPQSQTVIGNGTDVDVLRRAGLEEADAFVATTNGDNRNIMAAEIARLTFGVKKVLCRIYDPIRYEVYRELGLGVICPTIMGTDTVYDILVKD